MNKTPACLLLVLAAAACSKESAKAPTPAPAPAKAPAAAPAKEPAKAPEAAPANESEAAPQKIPVNSNAPAAALKLEKTTPSANYPLKTCVVSGEDLGDDRLAYKWGDTEVQFCCKDCPAEFEKEPEKYLAKIRAAAK